jgi:signal transduction histidine kinase
MQQDLQDDTSRVYMDIIDRNSRRISDLISQLLNTSRPSEITLEPSILQSVLDEVIGASIDRLTLNKMKLRVNYPEEPVSIMADAEKLKLALLNIVVNAIEAMKEGEGDLAISVNTTADNVILKIADNGSGISEEHIARLFEPYFTQKRNGVGLGLAFTLNILQSHGANIEVSSVEGQGTVFTIIFATAASYSKGLAKENIDEEALN